MYKIIKLLIPCLFITSLSYAQKFDAPNRYDSLGLKQGLWLELEAKPKIVGVTHLDLNNGRSEEKYKYDFDDYYVLKYYGPYENGLREGKWKVYSPNGSIRYIITYRNGVIYGEFKFYHPNGVIKLKGFIERKKITTVSYYDENGNFVKTDDWFTSGLVEKLNR